MIQYTGKYLQQRGTCVAYSANFVLEMFIKILQSKIKEDMSQTKYNKLLENLLTKRGICFGPAGPCVHNIKFDNDMMNNLERHYATPSDLNKLNNTNLMLIAMNLNISKSTINKIIENKPLEVRQELIKLILNIKKKQLPVISPLPNRPPNHNLSDMKLANLKQIARNRKLKGFSKYKKKQNLINFIQRSGAPAPAPAPAPVSTTPVYVPKSPTYVPLPNLSKMRVVNLKQIARNRKLKGFSKYKKKQNLINFIRRST
jgi:hypothetical protein